MPKCKLIWQVYPAFIFVTLVALFAATWYCTYAFRDFYQNQTREELASLAYYAAVQFSPLIDNTESSELDGLCKKLGSVGDGRTRVTVILPSGRVIADSDEDIDVMENHVDRPEIAEAFKGQLGWSTRFSHTLGKNMVYVAVPILKGSEPVAVVRTSISATAMEQALHGIYVNIIWSALVIALCTAGLSLLVSRRISQPVVRMQQIARSFSQGHLDLRVPVVGSQELASLGIALNEMARQLQDRIKTITDKRNELEAVLSSMVEGVLAVDRDGHIISINKAAADLLDVDQSHVRGRTVEEVVRNVDIQQFVRRTLKGEEPIEADVSLTVDGGRYFQLNGAALPDTHGERNGAVIVLNDTTRMRRLENVRRDFVANVSHELKTPVTSIQGFIEALLEGTINDPDKIMHYIKIISKHSNRLNSIIEDLLSLSRLEEDQENRRLSFDKVKVKPILSAAVDLLTTKAEQKKIKVQLSCDENIEATLNPALIEQAVFNLIDNGLKYSEQGKTIYLSLEQHEEEIRIKVKDEGCGIEKRHLSRLFERFYVVDKGRSRKLGGTGLGLAIVKHIAQVHGGYVTVESLPSKGSTFTIHLPVK